MPCRSGLNHGVERWAGTAHHCQAALWCLLQGWSWSGLARLEDRTGLGGLDGAWRTGWGWEDLDRKTGGRLESRAGRMKWGWEDWVGKTT